MDAISLSLFSSRIAAICDEMGAVLQRSSFSPNIRDRLDYSCAVFDARGDLCAQAAHIPVHLGSMAYAMRDIVNGVDWQAGDMVMLNDPYLGGTHLPDVTVIAPLFHDGELAAFVANRAHHADIGAETPGSMPVSSSLDQEGLVIPPTVIVRDGKLLEPVMQAITGNMRKPSESRADFVAQVSANRTGLRRLQLLLQSTGMDAWQQTIDELNNYAERLANSVLKRIPDGVYAFTDVMDDDGQGHTDLPVAVRITVEGHHIDVDFEGTTAQVPGNINCPLSVAAAAVYYVFRCLMPDATPACAGSFRAINIRAPRGCLLNAERPAAVAAGNVETSTRVVDVVCGALAKAVPELMPAASHGSMNNLAMGSDEASQSWDYYETIGGGMGAGRDGGGLSGRQTHMTNTLNTPIEAMEMHFPVRVQEYSIRAGSGGNGKRRGGDGLVRRLEFLQPATVTLLTERRRHQPWGLAGGEAGQAGSNRLNGSELPGKTSFSVAAGDVLSIETPGGGGWGKAGQD